jgi:hypothetical protein
MAGINRMGLDELFEALKQPKRIQDHPEWETFKTRKFPQYLSFYYTNQDGDEAYWDQARIIKLDLKSLYLIIEGTHGSPLKFDIMKIQHAKDAKTGEKVQELFFELTRLWKDVHE